MKKIVMLLVLFLSLSFYVNAQSQYYCIQSQQSTPDSWSYRIYYQGGLHKDRVEINVTTVYNSGTTTSTGWQPFTSGMTVIGSGFGYSSTVRIRHKTAAGVVLSEFAVTQWC